ncbi:hypothetical protein VcTj87_12250 [Vibrio comitans]
MSNPYKLARKEKNRSAAINAFISFFMEYMEDMTLFLVRLETMIIKDDNNIIADVNNLL